MFQNVEVPKEVEKRSLENYKIPRRNGNCNYFLVSIRYFNIFALYFSALVLQSLNSSATSSSSSDESQLSDSHRDIALQDQRKRGSRGVKRRQWHYKNFQQQKQRQLFGAMFSMLQAASDNVHTGMQRTGPVGQKKSYNNRQEQSRGSTENRGNKGRQDKPKKDKDRKKKTR